VIGRLSGTLIEKQAPHLLIDVAGVGYEVQAPMTSFYPLPDIGGNVTLHTHLSVSENAHQLFAFYTLEERLLFRTLIKVSGVGPKMALAILSGMAADDFVHCVRSDNVAALVRVPGVGKKTAERLIIEVKDRLSDWGSKSRTDSISMPLASSLSVSAIVADAESALIALGYKPTQAAQMISAAQKAETVTDSEALIRLALKNTVA
jgi:Holliday junction DNA helicase RuvA